TTAAENAEKARVSEWLAHDNAIFDLCWIKIKVWDVQEKKSIAILTRYTGSVKSISVHPSNDDVIVSSSQDGFVALWDLRGCQRDNAFTLINYYEKVVRIPLEGDEILQVHRERTLGATNVTPPNWVAAE
ncbi:denticleless protein homolog isoform X2, partial [Tanacetum coccineum]